MKVMIVPLLLPAAIVASGLASSLASGLAPAAEPQVNTPYRAGGDAAVAAPTPPPTLPLTLAGAIALAMAGNPDIAAARRELEALQADAGQAALAPNPSLDYVREGQDRQTRSETVQLSIPVELGGKRAARRDVAMIDIEAGRLALAATRDRVRAETVAAFYAFYLAGERLRVVQAGAATAATTTQAAARRVVAGKISPVEETRAKVAQAALKIELVQARRDQEEARLQLAALLPAGSGDWETVAAPAQANADPALPMLSMLPLLPTLPTLPSLAELAARIERSPALARAILEVERRRALARLEQAKRTPDISVLVGAKREGQGLQDRRQGIVGLALPLPLFDRNQGAILASLRRTDKARDELAAAATALRTGMARAHARLAAALQEVALIETDILPGAQSAADAAARGFELGKFSFLEVLDAQRTLFHSRSTYLKAVAEAHRAAADMAQAIGPEGPAAHEQQAPQIKETP